LIEVVVSDFGGVLTAPLEGSFHAFADQAGIPVSALGEALVARTAREGVNPIHRLEVGALTEGEFLGGLREDLAALGYADAPIDDFADAYFDHLQPNGPMLDALFEWKARGLRLALCTNNVAEWEGHWRRMLPIDELFEVVVDSAFVGVRKPDRRIYEIVLERLGGVPGEACVFIDDIAENCDGARALGMHPVHFVETVAAIDAVELRLTSDT
jgi:putative hydrolase of the HAD superfamily